MVEKGSDGPAVPSEYHSIQVLRGFAAMAVALHHALGHFDTHVPALAAGVDIFFVISGFVMAVSTEGRSLKVGHFLKRRIQRIVPLYWIALVVTLIMIAAGIMDRPFPPFFEILKAFTFVFYTDSYLNQPLPFLGVGWTLNYEMFYYLLFALTIFLGPVRQIGALAVIFAIAVVTRKFIDPNDGFALRMTSPLPFEFLFGMLVCRYRQQIGALPSMLLVVCLLFGIIILGVNIETARTLSGGASSAMIVVGFVGLEQRFNWRSLKLPLSIGDASYALYLFHGLVIVAVVQFIPPSAVIVGPIILVTLATVVSLLIYRVLERPLINFFRPAGDPQKPVAFAR